MGLYIVPLIGAGVKGDPRRPKYVYAYATQSGTGWSGMDFGVANWFLAYCDILPADEIALAANADFYVVAPLGNILGAAGVTNVQTKLEAIGVPAQWVTAGMSVASVVKTTCILFQIAQRLHGQNGSGFPPLNTTFGSLDAATQQSLLDLAASFGWDTSQLTASTTIRQALKRLADQWGTMALNIGPIAL